MFDKIRGYAVRRLALFVAKSHKQRYLYGWTIVVRRSPDCLGLINLNGTVIAPRPSRDRRVKPNAAR
jgi:RNA-directed DNA polymerase